MGKSRRLKAQLRGPPALALPESTESALTALSDREEGDEGYRTTRGWMLGDVEDLPDGAGACGGVLRPRWSRILRIKRLSARKGIIGIF